MKLRRFLAVLLALVMALGTTAVFAAETFTDVAEDAYYAGAVAWAAETKITEGKGNNRFDPEASVNRAEAVTFLWRMAGKPEPTQTETFTDVESDPQSVWYKTAVQWAVENGITVGTGKGLFSPTEPCSRGMSMASRTLSDVSIYLTPYVFCWKMYSTVVLHMVHDGKTEKVNFFLKNFFSL